MGTIFDIKRFAIHDGPGIRTTVFFKGCPLRCSVCHNPESQSFEKERFFRQSRCAGCGACALSCKPGAVRMENGSPTYDPALCLLCGDCSSACMAEAVELIGWEIEPADLMALVGRDRIFFEESGGGVTFSGGEPLSQPGFLLDMLELCRSEGLHTVVDTCGFADWEDLDRVRMFTDLFLFDVKTMDDTKHKVMTGVSNATILDNLGRLSTAGADVLVRFPLIPGINNDDGNLEALGRFLKALPSRPGVEILHLHSMGHEKYTRLGRKNHLPKPDRPGEDMYRKAADLLGSFGLDLFLKGEPHAHE